MNTTCTYMHANMLQIVKAMLLGTDTKDVPITLTFFFLHLNRLTYFFLESVKCANQTVSLLCSMQSSPKTFLASYKNNTQ